jgi:hypothetical protein
VRLRKFNPKNLVDGQSEIKTQSLEHEELLMKHKVSSTDRTYIDYVHDRSDGRMEGLRFRRGWCQYTGQTQDSQGLFETGKIAPLPLAQDAPDEVQREAGILRELFPDEIPALLSQTKTVDDFFE